MQVLRKRMVMAVHLHVRGADWRNTESESIAFGSSPRAWSRLVGTEEFPRHVRFISTCVEQTACPASRGSRWSVHLHVRGADRASDWKRSRAYRFISTCVEQTSVRRSSCSATAVHLHVRGADRI